MQRFRSNSDRGAHSISRVMVETTNDATGIQQVDAMGHSSESLPELEHFHPYGFTSNVLPPTGQRGQREGPEALALFPGGDRSHGVVMPASDRRHRRRNMQPGEVALHGQRAQNGDQNAVHIYEDRIEISVPAGKKVIVKVGTDTKLTVEKDKITGEAGANNAYFVMKKAKCVQMKKKGDPTLHITLDLEGNRCVHGKAWVLANDPFPSE